uniref:Uncharacterized protein n=1 Tax=Mycena chlorophos TaxID=658473 RepID=A0ABQ0LWI8_MYCCL|nr:predicted protein [Mycena chlorophos]
MNRPRNVSKTDGVSVVMQKRRTGELSHLAEPCTPAEAVARDRVARTRLHDLDLNHLPPAMLQFHPPSSLATACGRSGSASGPRISKVGNYERVGRRVMSISEAASAAQPPRQKRQSLVEGERDVDHAEPTLRVQGGAADEGG